MPSFHCANNKITIHTPQRNVWLWFLAFTVHLLLFAQILCITFHCQRVANVMITDPHVRPCSVTRTKTGLVHEGQGTSNVIPIHLNSCVWILSIVFIDNSRFYSNCSQFPCCPALPNEE